YGFSLDDDVANSSAVSNSLEVAFGGNEYTAPLPANAHRPQLKNLEGFTGGAPYGTFTTPSTTPHILGGATGSDTATANHNFTANHAYTIGGLSQAMVGQIVASTGNPGDPLPAFITSLDPNLPAGSVVFNLARVVPTGTQQDNLSWVSFKVPSTVT